MTKKQIKNYKRLRHRAMAGTYVLWKEEWEELNALSKLYCRYLADGGEHLFEVNDHTAEQLERPIEERWKFSRNRPKSKFKNAESDAQQIKQGLALEYATLQQQKRVNG